MSIYYNQKLTLGTATKKRTDSKCVETHLNFKIWSLYMLNGHDYININIVIFYNLLLNITNDLMCLCFKSK